MPWFSPTVRQQNHSSVDVFQLRGDAIHHVPGNEKYSAVVRLGARSHPAENRLLIVFWN